MHRCVALALALVAAWMAPGCSGAQHTSKADDRPTAAASPSGWSGADSEAAASAQVASMLGAAWLAQFTADEGRAPVLRSYPIKNRCPVEPAPDLRQLSKLIEVKLTESGKVTFVASLEDAEKLREQRRQEALHGDRTAPTGNETAADLTLSGFFMCPTHQKTGERIYLLTMMLNAGTERVWSNVFRVDARPGAG